MNRLLDIFDELIVWISYFQPPHVLSSHLDKRAMRLAQRGGHITRELCYERGT